MLKGAATLDLDIWNLGDFKGKTEEAARRGDFGACVRTKEAKGTFLAATMLGLSMAVLFAISRRSLFSLRGTASFWWGDKLNLAVAQRIAATA